MFKISNFNENVTIFPKIVYSTIFLYPNTIVMTETQEEIKIIIKKKINNGK